MSQRAIESLVGVFLLAAIAALIALAFKVSGLTSFSQQSGYKVMAAFDDIGQLKVRAPVKVAGVVIGEVSSISLDPVTFKADVTLWLKSSANDIPDDSSVSILTAGLLGDNYIALTPMYSKTFLHEGSNIQETHSAMILENLIGQLVYKISNPNSSSSNTSTTGAGK